LQWIGDAWTRSTALIMERRRVGRLVRSPTPIAMEPERDWRPRIADEPRAMFDRHLQKKIAKMPQE
jgi:hypothetical protein